MEENKKVEEKEELNEEIKQGQLQNVKELEKQELPEEKDGETKQEQLQEKKGEIEQKQVQENQDDAKENFGDNKTQKVVVISGGTSGIGLACADCFGANGYKVYALARREPENFAYNFIKCDLTVEDEIKNAVQQIMAKEKKVDVLICNAGTGISGPVEYSSLQETKRLFDVNFFASYVLSREFVSVFKKSGGGRIVFVSSVGGLFPLPYQAFYSASKSALEAYAYALRSEVKHFNIQIGCILPCDTKTGFTDSRVKAKVYPDYLGKDERSVKKMEESERNGMSPMVVAKSIYKMANGKHMKCYKIMGFIYKICNLLNRLLPKRFVLWCVKKLYG